MNTEFDLELKLFSLLDDMTPHLPTRELTNIRDLIQNREWGVGLEILCTQLYEYEVQLSRQTFIKIRDLCRDIGLPQSLWKDLQILIRENGQ